MERTRRTQAERSEATRRLLIDAGRRLFTASGFEATSAEGLARDAGVTRGALYHHFDGKRGLFRAVFEHVEQEIQREVLDGLDRAGTEHPRWRAAVDAFLDACLDPTAQRVVLLEAPSVLGWDLWREIDSDYFLGLITTLLEQGMEDGTFARQPARPIAQMLLGALTEAALAIARAPDQAEARAQFGAAAARLIDGLRDRGTRPDDAP